MPANMPAVEGTSNLTSFWGGFIKGVGGVITLTTTEVWGDENLITEEGLFEIKSKEGAQLDKGKYIVLWKKEDGKWKSKNLNNMIIDIIDKKIAQDQKITVVVSARGTTTDQLEDILVKASSKIDYNNQWNAFKDYQQEPLKSVSATLVLTQPIPCLWSL